MLTGYSKVSTSFGTVASAIAKATPGVLVAVRATNTNAALRYLQVFDRTTALSGGETPIISVPLPATSGDVMLDQSFFGDYGLVFPAGIVWGVSTARATYTAGTAADHQVHVVYV